MEYLLKIKQKRKELKLTQQTMGKYLGMAKETYRDIENGKILLSLDNYLRIIKILDISSSFLFPDKKVILLSDDEKKILRETSKILNKIMND